MLPSRSTSKTNEQLPESTHRHPGARSQESDSSRQSDSSRLRIRLGGRLPTIGSCWIFGCAGRNALAFSAAHVFQEVVRSEERHDRSVPSMLDILRPLRARPVTLVKIGSRRSILKSWAEHSSWTSFECISMAAQTSRFANSSFKGMPRRPLSSSASWRFTRVRSRQGRL